MDLGTNNGLMPTAVELTMLSRLLTVPGIKHAMQIIGIDLCLLVLWLGGSMVLQGSHNECTTITLNHSTWPHKWWESLKGSIFGVGPTIHAFREPGGGLVVASAEKASLLGFQFYGKQGREQFVFHLIITIIIKKRMIIIFSKHDYTIQLTK